MNEIFLREILETLMLICFGFAWPISIAKSIRSKTSKGKSILFLFIILTGYLCGIMKKIVCQEIGIAIIFYSVNLIMVCLDIFLWIRNYWVYDRESELSN
ncbi:MAG: hypothetical protein ACIAQZ_13575 [Sedimentisphaeraceae bacterium JB056]